MLRGGNGVDHYGVNEDMSDDCIIEYEEDPIEKQRRTKATYGFGKNSYPLPVRGDSSTNFNAKSVQLQKGGKETSTNNYVSFSPWVQPAALVEGATEESKYSKIGDSSTTAS